MVEATFPSSYTSFFFYIQLQILDDDCTPTKNSPGFNIGLPNGHRQFPRLVPETSKKDLSAKNLRTQLTFAPLSANCYDRQLSIQNSISMTTRWYFDRTVTQREILERNRHHKHLFVIRSTLKTDGF